MIGAMRRDIDISRPTVFDLVGELAEIRWLAQAAGDCPGVAEADLAIAAMRMACCDPRIAASCEHAHALADLNQEIPQGNHHHHRKGAGVGDPVEPAVVE